MSRRPFVSIPQDGPGHKAVTLVAGRDRLRIECDSNEKAKALSKSLIGLLKHHFPKGVDKPTPHEHLKAVDHTL